MSKQALLTLESVFVTFPGAERPIVNDVSLSVRKGERLLIAGPSGCGKSTLAYVLNGILPRAMEATVTGAVKLEGEPLDARSIPDIAAKVGILFQDPESQFCMQTVEEEVAFGLENLRLPQADMEKRIVRSLEQVGLAGEQKSQLHHLSGGMKQRLGLACILAMDPEVLILDEPTANLDPEGANELLDIVIQLAETSGKTLIFIEHRLDRIIPYIDRVLLMNQTGSIIANGTPRQLYDEQMHLFQAEGAAVPLVCKRAVELAAKGQEWAPFPLSVEEGENQLQLSLSGEYGEECEPQAKREQTTQPSPRELEAGKSAPIMEVNGITFHYKHNEIIRGATFKLFPGIITALLGTNGAGKSTLIQLLAKLTKPHSGTIKLKQLPLAKWKDRELYQTLGYVFQNPEHQFLRDTVEAELAFSLHRSGRSEQQQKEKIEAQLTAFGLQHVRSQHPFQLSQGQKRRLSVATMLSNDQELLMLDEPTFGQDARYTELLMSMLQELRASGTGILLITHDMELVRQHADQVLVLHEGRIAFDGLPDELFGQAHQLQTYGLQEPLSRRLEKWTTKKLEAIHHA